MYVIMWANPQCLHQTHYKHSTKMWYVSGTLQQTYCDASQINGGTLGIPFIFVLTSFSQRHSRQQALQSF